MSRLQPRLKALATSNISSQSATANRDPIPEPETTVSRQNIRVPSTDALSERATLFLIRRTLCSQFGDKGRSTPAPIDEILPPLTSSNEVDLQLYALIAIIIREFVQTWYAKITPDQVFVEEVVKIIAHFTRALEQRLRNVDLESLLFDELPELLEVHVQGALCPQHERSCKLLKPTQHIELHTLRYTLLQLNEILDKSTTHSGLCLPCRQYPIMVDQTLHSKCRTKRHTDNC
jgi:hypothetical protein